MTVIQEKPSTLAKSAQTSLLIGLGIASKMTLDLVIAARFGLGVKTDAFFVAYTLPLIIEALIYPACQSGLAPIFVRQMRSDQVNDKWAVFSTLINIGLLTSVALTALGAAAAPFVTLLLAPGMAPSGQETAIHLMRILFMGTLIVGPVGVMRAFLNAHGLFTAPAMVELVRGTAVLGTIAVAYGSLGIEAVAWGYVIGGLLQFLTLASVIVRRLGLGYRLTIKLQSLRSSQAGRLFMVPLADYALGQTILIVERVIGSFMPAGSISTISYGHRLASVIANVLFGGLEVVSLSSLAADFSEGTFDRLHQARKTFVTGLRIVLIVGISISISVWALSFRLVQLLFERGAFDRQATLLAAPVLGLYALSTPFYGYWLLLRNYLLAAIQPKKVLVLSCTSTGVNIALALLLSEYMGASGMALAYVGGVGVVFGLGFLMLDEEMKPFQKAMIRLAGTVAGASVAVGFVLYSVSNQVSDLLSRVQSLSSFLVRILALIAAGLSGAILLPVILVALQVEEAKLLLQYLRRMRTG